MFSESGSSSSSSSSSRAGWKYDVFLSFRGEDTRKNFTDHLYYALVQAGIYTFRDDEALPRGQEISSQLRQAIRESRISIVVFSKGYASSRWCLDELEEIVECKQRNKDQIILPIFYDTDPSDVRKQTGSFKEAFDGHEERFKEKVNKWREVLLEAGNLSGWNLKDMANGHEAKFIQMIVGDVSKKLDNKLLDIAKCPVGIDSRVCRVIDELSTGDVCVLGIYGMPGVGKTTIAKAIFNRLCLGYDGCCFLFDVKEESKKGNGLVQLQEDLLYQVLKPNVFKVDNEHRGIILIKERLSSRRVLIVVDDVDQREQLNALVGEKSWFGPGSIILITTRNERLLTQFEVDKKFKLEELDKDESLELFSWHAFRNTHPLEDYLEHSWGVVKHCGGLPLALEVLGSSLFERNQIEWESAIEKLRKIPHTKIEKKLEISFDTLDDDIKRDFLDISCFFIGRGKEYVTQIVDARCGFKSEINIVTLIERSLLTVDCENKLRMHDLLRDMGREIVRRMSPQHPGKRSRIWLHEDAQKVLKKQKGTDAVEGLALDVREAEALSFSTKSFTNMRHLQLLQINGAQLVGSYEYLSRDLIWLCWREFPLKSLPSNFQLDNITVLDMQRSNLIELWREIKPLNMLKILDLSHSKYLAKTPNLLGSPNLERLILEDCPSLIEVHQSIGHLRKLVFLNLEGCCKLRNLPQSIGNLKSLKTLNINMCSQLEKLPDSLGDMESLIELLADETGIMTLPSSIGNLKNLIKLSLGLNKFNYRHDTRSVSWLSKLTSRFSPKSSSSKALLPASFSGLSSLRELNLRYRGLSESKISSADFGSLYSLKELDLTGNDFFNLPSGIVHLPKLKTLLATDCNNLLSISEIPSSLESLYAGQCKSLEMVSLPKQRGPKLWVEGCQKLKEIQGIEAGANSFEFWLGECNNVPDDSKRILYQSLGDDYDFLAFGGEVPEWFNYRGEGCSISFQIPNTVSHGELQALVVWSVCTRIDSGVIGLWRTTSIKNKTNGNLLFVRRLWIYSCLNYEKHSWISHMTFTGLPIQIEGGDELEVYVSVGTRYQVERCGVHLILQKPDTTSANVVVDDETQSSTPLGCSEGQWRSYLTKELLQPSLQITYVSSNRNGQYEIEGDCYGWAQKEGESDNYHRVKCRPLWK